MERKCPFEDCTVAIPSTRFGCSRHWYQLTKAQQRRIWTAYDEWKAGTIDGERLRAIQAEVLLEWRHRRDKQPTAVKGGRDAL